MPYADLPGVQLWYTDTGDNGVPLVLLHAASGTSESWIYQLPAFTAAGYRCIAYDRRYWGRSRQNSAGPQPGTYCDDLLALLDHLALDRVHLVATAAGGVAAFDFALSYSERVNRLIVADTIGGMQDPEYLEVQHRIRPAEIATLPVELREVGPGYRGINPAGLQRWLEIEHASRPRAESVLRQPPKQQMMLRALESLTMPVLVIAGEADLLTPPAYMRLLAAHIPNCRFATVPEAGHAAFWEQPETWNRLVIEFLAEK
jgi:pimeloyl-ACP methyl ester carboxylesterase